MRVLWMLRPSTLACIHCRIHGSTCVVRQHAVGSAHGPLEHMQAGTYSASPALRMTATISAVVIWLSGYKLMCAGAGVSSTLSRSHGTGASRGLRSHILGVSATPHQQAKHASSRPLVPWSGQPCRDLAAWTKVFCRLLTWSSLRHTLTVQ